MLFAYIGLQNLLRRGISVVSRAVRLPITNGPTEPHRWHAERGRILRGAGTRLTVCEYCGEGASSHCLGGKVVPGQGKCSDFVPFTY